MVLLRAATAFASELRHAARRLSRCPGFAALAIATLTVGVGINTAMFALMDALLFRPPFHIAEPAQVVRVQFRLEHPQGPSLIERTHYSNYVGLKASGAFAAIAAYTTASVSIGSGPDASLASAMLVTREFFDVLRPSPHLGSLSLGESVSPEGGDRAILSYGFWQRHFGGEPRAVGATLTIDGRIYSIGGVTPSGFQSLSARPIDIWLPLDHARAAAERPFGWRDNREDFWLSAVGRLAHATSDRVAEQRATAMLRNRGTALGDTDSPLTVLTTSIVPGRGSDKPLENKVSLWLAGVSAFVLLIACANVSNLVLARTFAQRREYFIRLTLGASRWDLVRRSLSDTFAIVIPGAAGAVVVSFFLRNAVSGFLSGDIPLSRELWDARTAGIMAGSGALAFALVCAVSLSQLPPACTATPWLEQASNPRALRTSTRRTLLAVQAGLCLALLVVAGLFATSLRRVEALDLGVDVDRTIQLTINLPSSHRRAGESRAMYEQALAVLAAHPEVEQAALTERSPYKSGSAVGPWTAERSRADLWDQADEFAYRSVVGARFFSTVGPHSLRGRDFNESDRAGAEPVAIINAPLARRLWPSSEAIGQCMWLDDEPACVRIVGVLDGVWKFYALKREGMAVYLPLAQVSGTTPGMLYIRPRVDARKFLAQARSIVQTLRPDLPAARAVLVRDIVDPEFRPWRMGATVFSAFAAVALLIASIGLYGVVAVSTALRVKEIGIRMALGARWHNVISVVVGEGIASVAGGLFGGAVLVAVASRWLGGLLFETSPRDAGVLIQTAFVLLAVSAVAMCVPTIRALRTNPANVLRSD